MTGRKMRADRCGRRHVGLGGTLYRAKMLRNQYTQTACVQQDRRRKQGDRENSRERGKTPTVGGYKSSKCL